MFYNIYFFLLEIKKCIIFASDNLNNLFALKTNTY